MDDLPCCSRVHVACKVNPLAFPGLQSLGTELIHASHLRVTLSGVDLSHRSYLQFTGILLSGHQHGSPPFNVAGPLISCLTFGVHSTNAVPFPRPLLLLGDARTLLRKRKLCPKKMCQLRGSPHTLASKLRPTTAKRASFSPPSVL